MKISLIIFTICISLISAKQEQDFSYVPGRSGDILLRSKNYKDNSVVYLINNDANMDTINDQSFADLVSHLVGGPVINSEVSRESFPKSSLFDKSSGNLLFVVDAVDSESLSQFNDLKMIKSGKPISLEKTSYPQDTVASAATLSSGVSPSVHGITGATWASYLGQIHAYRAGALPFVQNLADSFSQTFDGKSFIYSSSSNFQMSSAFGVNQFVHYPFNNEVSLFFNSNVRKFESVYSSGINVESLLISASDITRMIGASNLAMPGPMDSMVFHDAEYTIKMPSKNLEASIGANEFALFFAELLSVRNLNDALINNEKFKALTTDAYPDLYTFSFASLKGIERKHGRDSAHYKIAIYLLDEAIAAAIKSFSSIYSSKISTEIIFMAKSASESLNENRQVKNEVYSVIRNSVRKDIYDNNFPSIYLNEKADREIACDTLKALISDFDVYCANPYDSTLFPSLAVGDWPSVNNQTTNGTKDAAIFQISLWAPIFLGLALLATIIAFCTMDIGADSMIYRSTTNVRHAHSS